MTSASSRLLHHFGADLTHARLTELFKLADAAKPFYDWIERQCQKVCKNKSTLSNNLMAMSLDQLIDFIQKCYNADPLSGLPALFDGKGQQYPHRKACFYFFGWMVRDAPVQRLSAIIDRASRNREAPDRLTVEIAALAKLFFFYRRTLATFHWASIREVIYDRLEGSRRASRGRQKEIVVRTAVAAAVQKFFEENQGYGRFASILIPKGGIRIGTEEFDVVVNLLDKNARIVERVLFAVKSRETEGGGHSHLFTRDIRSAITDARGGEEINWTAAFIIAQNWSDREVAHVKEMCDFVVALPINPTAFETVAESVQSQLDTFFAGVLSGNLTPRFPSTRHEH